MNQRYPFYLLCSVIALAMFFAGCKKVDQELKKDPLATINDCRVSSMTYVFPYDSVQVNIEYTKWGDPARIRQTTTGTGRPDGAFLYNNKRQLTDYIGLYDDQFFEFWHQYVYDKKGQVVADTVYFWGSVVNGAPDVYYDAAVVTYEYDAVGRISHTVQTWYNQPDYPLHTYYNYDAAGNLEIPGVVYDNKACIHRTSRIWMFIDRNYSLNNGYATAWHDTGLPSHFSLSSAGGQFAGFYNGNLKYINYDCNGKVPKGNAAF